MKVKKLLELLAKADPGAQVILQKDGEGNGFSPLEGADLSTIYKARHAWEGDVFDEKWTASDAGLTERQWAALKRRPRCVLLFPVN